MGKADLKKRKLVAETEAQEAEEVIDERSLFYMCVLAKGPHERTFKTDQVISIQQM